MIKQAAEIVKNGGVIVYLTDTVWGLGCNALDKDAVKRLLKIKQKPASSSLIWLLPSTKSVKKYFPSVTAAELRLLEEKRTTVVLGCDQAVRVVKNGQLNKLISACGVPVVSTSANIHGQSVIQAWHQGATVFSGLADAVIRGRKTTKPVPSTIVKIENGETKILRSGGGISIK